MNWRKTSRSQLCEILAPALSRGFLFRFGGRVAKDCTDEQRLTGATKPICENPRLTDTSRTGVSSVAIF